MINENLNEQLREAIESNRDKKELGHVSLHEARELIMDAGALLLDVRPPAKVAGENAQEADIPNAYSERLVRQPDQRRAGNDGIS